MKRISNKHNHAIILTIAVMTLMATSLTGCSKKPATDEASTPSPQSTVESKPTEEVGASSEAEPAPTIDASSEPVVYEGIDVESDLPGEEWVKTFIDVVDEPVTVIYNDNTGRKEIIQEGSNVSVNPDEDIFAVYLPEGTTFSHLGIPANTEFCDEYVIAKVDQTRAKEGTRIIAETIVKKGTEEITTTFKVVIE